jgi:hypothetical protein
MQANNVTYADKMIAMAFTVRNYKAMAETYRIRGQYSLMSMALTQAEHVTACMEEAQEARSIIRSFETTRGTR